MNTHICIVDVETTGLSPWRNDRIVEIGIVIIDSQGAIIREYETLVNPGRDIGPSHIHSISAHDVLRAPTFTEVAGDILTLLSDSAVLAGHNVSFDKNFLVKEYDRLGVALPEVTCLCTCRLFGRASLQSCCSELGIPFDGVPHRALTDARATAAIIAKLHLDDPSRFNEYRHAEVRWPYLEPLNTPCFSRAHARDVKEGTPNFLQRIASAIHHDVDAEAPNVLAYMALIDRVLEDRTIDQMEEDALVHAATNWNLTHSQVKAAHANYLHNLVAAALADGVVSQSERRDLHLVANLLGQDQSTLDHIIESASSVLATVRCQCEAKPTESGLRGKSVCFTGQLQSTIGGQLISRDLAEKLAADVGLIIASNVTKKLDFLVVADPNTQSGKAKKARDYGVRVLSDTVFWRMTGISVE